MRFAIRLVLGVGLAAATFVASARGVEPVSNQTSQTVSAGVDYVPQRQWTIPIPPTAWMGLSLLGGVVAVTLIRRRWRNQP
jgi:hypothetical protein